MRLNPLTAITFLVATLVATIPFVVEGATFGHIVWADESADNCPMSAPMTDPADMRGDCAATAPAASPTGSATESTPQASQPCPAWVHDRYAVTGPDGKQYPTWHPAIDSEFGCLFGHEHGADPRTSRANADLPAFGYAAAQMDMVEPHVGFKVFVMNAGDVVESNVSNKVADQDVRLVFHMGTSGVNRFTEPFHSMQYDLMDHASGRVAHVTGMADTGPLERAGSTCDQPRRGGKDFSTIGCGDSYEIWNFVRFQILDPSDPFSGLMESRFGAAPSVAVFDPVTSRDPSDNSRLLLTQELRGDPLGRRNIDPRSADAYYQGCRREMYAAPAYWHNAGKSTIYYTDALGHVAPSGQMNATHPIRQEISADTGGSTVNYKARADFCGAGVHFPN